MDVLVISGESSSDIMAAELIEELQKCSGYSLDIAVIGSSESRARGVRYLFDHITHRTVGLDRQGAARWLPLLHQLIDMVEKDPPKVFVGVTHHVFNLLVAERLPPTTVKVMIEPPEIWGWDVKWFVKFPARIAGQLTRLLIAGHVKRWLLERPGKVGRFLMGCKALTMVVFRGERCLRYFDLLVCCTRMNEAKYRKLKKDKGGGAKIVYVGQPALQKRYLSAAKDALRRSLNLSGSDHVLAVLPSTRIQTIKLLLPEMLRAVSRVLKEREYVVAVVHVPDVRFVELIRRNMNKHGQRWVMEGRLLYTLRPDDELLAGCSHAILSSGTLTLCAAYAGAPATVAYDVPGPRSETLKFIMRRVVERTEVEKCSGNSIDIPFALPNVAMLWKEDHFYYDEEDDLPYNEYVLEDFNAEKIAKDVLKHLPNEPFRGVRPRLRRDVVVRIIKRGFEWREGRDPMKLTAKYVYNAYKGRDDFGINECEFAGGWLGNVAAEHEGIGTVSGARRRWPTEVRNATACLAQRGWFVSDAMDWNDVRQALALAQGGQAHELDSFMVELTRKHLFQVEKRLLTAWPDREAVLVDAFEAHNEGKYILSIPVLIAQSNGICFDLTGRQLFLDGRELEPSVREKAGSLVADMLEAPIRNGIAILHGRDVTYASEANSLRAILFLDCLPDLLGAARSGSD